VATVNPLQVKFTIAVDDQRVVEFAHALDRLDDPADLIVGI
jgi:hypothetical protein